MSEYNSTPCDKQQDAPARIRIEDMTLGQIQGLKKEIADELNGYLAGLSEMISRRFDVGAIGFSVDTELCESNFRFADTDEPISSWTKYNINIHFSKEDV